MKFVIIITVVVFILIIWVKTKPSSFPAADGFSDSGVLSDTPKYLEALTISDDPHSFLVITHTPSDEFIQFSAGNNIVQMDYPLITEQQNSNAKQLKKICSGLGLVLEENTGTDGSKFYDWNLTGSAEEMFEIIAQVFIEVFGAKSKDVMFFQHDGLNIKQIPNHH